MFDDYNYQKKEYLMSKKKYNFVHFYQFYNFFQFRKSDV